MRYLLLSAAALMAAITLPVEAAEVERYNFNHAVAACQPALPAFDGMIRKRPKALANEGTSTAFVSCSNGTNQDTTNTVGFVRIVLLNRNASAVTISCTLVDGIGDSTFSSSITKSVVLNPGERKFIDWFAADNGNVKFSLPALSCGLPARTEVSGMSVTYLDSIGAS